MRVVKTKFYKPGFQAKLDGWTKIRNHGYGDSTLTIRLGKKYCPTIWEDRMFKLEFKDNKGKLHTLIINIDELMEAVRYG
jgi:hypothetical protein